ncbi:MAG: hypothetical protein ACXAAP_14825 [Candidatus Thorarchaeota archaeon]|jgi:hypothetical protein
MTNQEAFDLILEYASHWSIEAIESKDRFDEAYEIVSNIFENENNNKGYLMPDNKTVALFLKDDQLVYVPPDEADKDDELLQKNINFVYALTYILSQNAPLMLILRSQILELGRVMAELYDNRQEGNIDGFVPEINGPAM